MEKIADVLEILAKQLGTTVEFLWGVLLKQAKVESMLALVAIIVSSLFVIIALALLWYGYKIHKSNIGVSTFERTDPFGWFMGGIVISLFSLIAIGVNTYNYIIATYNPEYWALNEILKLLK